MPHGVFLLTLYYSKSMQHANDVSLLLTYFLSPSRQPLTTDSDQKKYYYCDLCFKQTLTNMCLPKIRNASVEKSVEPLYTGVFLDLFWHIVKIYLGTAEKFSYNVHIKIFLFHFIYMDYFLIIT